MERVWGRLKRTGGCACGQWERRESGADFKASNLGGVQGRYLNTPLALTEQEDWSVPGSEPTRNQERHVEATVTVIWDRVFLRPWSVGNGK